MNTRTTEIFRQRSIEPPVRAAGRSPDQARYMPRARTLSGPELKRRVATFTAGTRPDLSPVAPCSCSEEMLEPVLLDAARRTGRAEIQFNYELTDFAPDAEGVVARLRDTTGHGEVRVRARYLIDPDGAANRVHELVAIPMRGRAGLFHAMNILFRADLARWYADRPFNLCVIENPRAPARNLSVPVGAYTVGPDGDAHRPVET